MKEARLSHATFEAFLRQPKREKNYRGCRDYDYAPLNGTKGLQICPYSFNAKYYLQLAVYSLALFLLFTQIAQRRHL
ncbi:unnamed protein product [Ixodes pacificus]